MSPRAETIAQLFPPEAAVEDAVPSTTEAELLPEEAPIVARAVERRRRELAAGRLCVRRALVRLGHEPVAVPHDDRRAPIWPPGVVGSISHTGDYCAAVVARREAVRAVGLDVERDAPVKERLWDRICTERELAWIAGRDVHEQGRWVRLVFSAKEAFYKCQYLVTSTYLGFHEAELSLSVDVRRWTATLAVDAGPMGRGTTIEGGWVVDGGLIATGCWLPAR